MHDKFHDISSIAEIPLFHGDQWEITVPSLLGLDQVLLIAIGGGRLIRELYAVLSLRRSALIVLTWSG